MRSNIIFLAIVSAVAGVHAQTALALSGHVSSTGGLSLSGVNINLMGRGLTTVSDANGNFAFSSTAIRPNQGSSKYAYSFDFMKDGISLSLAKQVANGRVELFNWAGKKEASLSLDGMEAGLHDLAFPRLNLGVYVMRLSLDGVTYAHRLLRTDDKFLDAGSGGIADIVSAQGGTHASAKIAAVVDSLAAVKTGYQNAKVFIGSLTQGRVQIIMTPVCTIPTLPAVSALPAIAKMPDPFLMIGGSRITTKAQWDCRREEISAQFQNYELGTKPPRPASVTAAVTGNNLAITVTEGAKTMSFTVVITKPTTGTAPYPVLIGFGGSNLSDVLSLGVATLNFDNNGMAANTAGSSDRGKGKFYDFYGSTHSAGALMAWAWAVSRIIDALETTPEAGLDPTRVAVTGCSRNGKGAIIAGAFDARIALTIPQESGSGGIGNWRVSDYIGTTTQTQAQIIGEQPWFSTAFNAFSGKTTQIPFDHHTLVGLVAPRALLVFDNSDYIWLGAQSGFSSSTAGKRIYTSMGADEAMTYSEVGGHTHCSFPTSQKHWVDAYVTKYLLGGAGEAAKIENSKSYLFDEVRWVDWTTPTLQ